MPPATRRGRVLPAPLALAACYAKNGMMMSARSSEPEGRSAVKPLFWIGDTRDKLRGFPEKVKDVTGFALYQAQRGGRHVAAKPLKGFGGAGVLEVVVDDGGSTFRGVYTVKFPGAVYALDVFQKKSKKGAKTPQGVVSRIKKRLQAAEVHYEQWLASRGTGRDGG